MFNNKIKETISGLESDYRNLKSLMCDKQHKAIQIKTRKFKYFHQYDSYSDQITKEEYLKSLRLGKVNVFKTEMLVNITLDELIHLLLDYMGITIKYGMEKRTSETKKYMIVKRTRK